MSKLNAIQDTVQQIAHAISTVLQIETMILDENLRIVAGTGKYLDQIGSLEAEANLPEEYLYKYILRVGGVYVVEDINDPLYGPEQYGETGEVCCAIPYKTGSAGIISLVSFNEDQHHNLIDHKEPICEYLKTMASLISSYLSNTENFAKLNLHTKMLDKIINSSPHCILVIDKNGYIEECNQKSRKFLLGDKDDFWGVSGKHIDSFWQGAHQLLLTHKNGIDNLEARFNEGDVRILLSSKPVSNDSGLQQFVLFFDDMLLAKQNAHMILSDKVTGFDSIQGTSSQLTAIKDFASQIAPGNSTVLITGESGTGKELFARAIHNASSRCSEPFVTINCGAIPESLIESELFGYEDGAFTGAVRGGRIGKFELADGGTVFIDEIGELPLHMQVKLLHVLQRREFERVGSSETKRIDVRIIAATNRDLAEMCRQKKFREDLYYRLNVIPINIPPLRERKEDIPVLANYFLEKHSQILEKNVTHFSVEALDALMLHEWPGNVRELENAIEYSVNMAKRHVVVLHDLPPMFHSAGLLNTTKREDASLKPSITNYENSLLMQYLREAEEGKITKGELAKKLGISRSSLYRKINRLKDDQES